MDSPATVSNTSCLMRDERSEVGVVDDATEGDEASHPTKYKIVGDAGNETPDRGRNKIGGQGIASGSHADGFIYCESDIVHAYRLDLRNDTVLSA